MNCCPLQMAHCCICCPAPVIAHFRHWLVSLLVLFYSSVCVCVVWSFFFFGEVVGGDPITVILSWRQCEQMQCNAESEENTAALLLSFVPAEWVQVCRHSGSLTPATNIIQESDCLRGGKKKKKEKQDSSADVISPSFVLHVISAWHYN